MPDMTVRQFARHGCNMSLSEFIESIHPDTIDIHGFELLNIASTSGNLPIVQYLVEEHNIYPHRRLSTRRMYQSTEPLENAMQQKQYRTVIYLAHQISPTITFANLRDYLHRSDSFNLSWQIPDYKSNSVLRNFDQEKLLEEAIIAIINSYSASNYIDDTVVTFAETIPAPVGPIVLLALMNNVYQQQIHFLFLDQERSQRNPYFEPYLEDVTNTFIRRDNYEDDLIDEEQDEDDIIDQEELYLFLYGDW